MSEDLLAEISESVIGGEPEVVVAHTRQALGLGLEPMEIINQGLVPGMDTAGGKIIER